MVTLQLIVYKFLHSFKVWWQQDCHQSSNNFKLSRFTWFNFVHKKISLVWTLTGWFSEHTNESERLDRSRTHSRFSVIVFSFVRFVLYLFDLCDFGA